jgi:hypothetical protein
MHVTATKAVMVSLLADAVRAEALANASRFRDEFCACLTARRDELFELADAVLCVEEPVVSPVDLTLVPEHRRGAPGGRHSLRQAWLRLPRHRGGRRHLAPHMSSYATQQ